MKNPTARVLDRLPTIKVEVQDSAGQRSKGDNTTQVHLEPGGTLFGVITVTAQDGGATFDNVFMGRRGLVQTDPRNYAHPRHAGSWRARRCRRRIGVAACRISSGPPVRSEALGVWQLPAYLLKRGHEEYPGTTADRGCGRVFEVHCLPGGPGC